MIWFFLGIFLISFLLAVRSMKDFYMPEELKKMISAKKIKGKIIFLKNKIIFYKNHSSSSSSETGG